MNKRNLFLTLFCSLIICFSGCGEEKKTADPVIDPPVLTSGLKLGMQEAYFSLQSGGDSWKFPDLAAAKQMFDYMDDLKIKRFRYTIFWIAAEPNIKGTYEWDRHDELINYLVGKGIKLTVTLFGDNWRYVSDGSSPYPGHSDSGYWNGWLNFVDAAVVRYKDRVSSWEIWNEPDLASEAGSGIFWAPLVSSTNFSSMLIATAEKIKFRQQEASVVLGGLTTLPCYRSFLTECLDKGILDSIDEIGVHLYRFQPEGYFSLILDPTVDIDPATAGVQSPSTFLEDITSLHSFIDTYKADVPVRNTEEGFYCYSTTGEIRNYSHLKYLTRSVLHQRRLGIEEITLFRLRVVKRTDYVSGDPDLDSKGDNSYNNDFNYPGIIDQVDLTTFTPRPVYYALKNMASYLSDPDAKYVQGKTVDVGGLKVHVEIYSKNSKPVIAYWIEEDINNTIKDVRNIALTIDGIGNYTYKVADIADNSAKTVGAYQVSGGGISFAALPVTDYPFILYAE